jgi:hypothetical protein
LLGYLKEEGPVLTTLLFVDYAKALKKQIGNNGRTGISNTLNTNSSNYVPKFNHNCMQKLSK